MVFQIHRQNINDRKVERLENLQYFVADSLTPEIGRFRALTAEILTAVTAGECTAVVLELLARPLQLDREEVAYAGCRARCDGNPAGSHPGDKQ